MVAYIHYNNRLHLFASLEWHDQYSISCSILLHLYKHENCIPGLPAIRSALQTGSFLNISIVFEMITRKGLTITIFRRDVNCSIVSTLALKIGPMNRGATFLRDKQVNIASMAPPTEPWN